MITNTEQMKAALKERMQLAGLEHQCLSDGAFHSQIAIIAEAPGEREAETGRPLIGGSGSKLWEVLRKFGISRNDVYITNVCKRQVSLGKDKRHPINRHETESWISLLQWELGQLPNLKYVLVLGNMALEAITGHTGITNWRGSVLDARIPVLVDGVIRNRDVQAVVTYNPAYVLREPKMELTFRHDCSKLKRIVDGKWEVIPVKSILNPSHDDVMDYLDMLEKQNEPVAYDIEVISGETACIGFAKDDREGMCVAFRNRTEALYTLDEERNIRRRIQRFLTNGNVRLVAQNGHFDASWLAFKDRIVPKPHYFDTMLAHHLLYPLLPHNLGYITTQYTTRPFYKDEGKAWREGGDIDEFWHYNVQDCCNTHAAHFGMLSELKQQNMQTFFFEHVMRLQPHLIGMTVGGLLVDTKYKNSLKSTLETRIVKMMEDFHSKAREVTGIEDYSPNPNSPKDMSDLLFSKLRLVGKGASTDAENRKQMYAHPATTEPKREVLRSLDNLKEEQKFYSTYATMQVDEDDRLRAVWNQIGVQSAPGRLSSSQTLWGSGMNMQNQPERSHPMFIADPGYAMFYFDLAQAEARVVGWMANIEVWIRQFEQARIDGLYDAHRALASEMFDVPYDQVPAFDRYDSAKGHVIPDGKKSGDVTIRYIAKRCRHGLNYRMGPDRLSSVTGLSLAEATNAYRTYHRITPELAQWWAAVEKEVRDNGSLYNAFGRRWLLMERLSPEALESIVAFKPQSTVGDKVSRVIYQSHDDPRWPSAARIRLNIHDAVIGVAPKHQVQKCLSIVKKYAEEPIMINNRELIIPADLKVSYENQNGYHSWGSLKSIQVEAAR